MVSRSVLASAFVAVGPRHANRQDDVTLRRDHQILNHRHVRRARLSAHCVDHRDEIRPEGARVGDRRVVVEAPIDVARSLTGRRVRADARPTMDYQTIVGIASGVGVAIGLGIHQALQSRKNRGLGERVTTALQARNDRTLRELAEELGMGGFLGRGKVFNALTEMTNAGALEVLPVPEGTPQLKKVDFIRYRLRG